MLRLSLLSVALAGLVHSTSLTVLKTTTTPNGFHEAARGWNSFGIQANPNTTPSWTGFNQGNVTPECDVLATAPFKAAGYQYCSLDSGWSTNNGDQYGRLLYDPTLFDLPSFADHLHDEGLKLGVYVLPGAFCSDGNKTIKGTTIKLNSTYNGNNDGFLRCDFDFSKPGVQEWHNSVVDLFASWGVDFIKLDFVTPGSPDNGAHLVANNSGAVIAYHNAIAQSGRQMRLHISWKLERNDTYYDIWRANADSMRTDQDINNSGANNFTMWQTVQRAIDNYRQYIVLQIPKNQPISIYPDMDNLFVVNSANISGVTDAERQSIISHWIGAAANLIHGGDLENIDDLGLKLATDSDAFAAADFSAQYPMQPRNPGTGGTDAQQLQAWIGGPSDDGEAVVILANYGPAGPQAGFNTSIARVQTVSASLDDLGIDGSGWNVFNIWDKTNSSVSSGGSLSADLDEGESVFLKLTKSA
ncbi:family 27 glycoside hydrolase [Rhizodiscina lignyota]|uniref:Alpha-galactosidase n=1 Tax=Rhizodiscina lignyota TaxID=1504668 RepID=A0A9P4IMI3_9PEZI|nr:family 27 glycoside hydrolase [Rhizodiscina lignyota]